MGFKLYAHGKFGHVSDPPEPPELTEDEFCKYCLLDEYRDNEDFKRYVDKCSVCYGKSLDEVLDLRITWEYFLSLQEGGCNHK